jgi:tetratricopeptide (TPR) repeat protein
MSKWNLSLALLPALLLSSTASAQNSMLRGKVRSTNGTTVNNAIVELRKSGAGLIAQTVTHNDGDFTFDGLIPAEYEVEVTCAGYEPRVERVIFNQAAMANFREILNVEVMVKPKPDAMLAAPGTTFAQDVPKAARAAYEKAIAKLEEGKSADGIALLREATGLFNNYFNAYYALARELYRTGKLDEALEPLEHARQLNEREGAVYYLFGLVMFKQQKFAVAEYAFKETTSLNGNSPAAHFYHGMTLIELALRAPDPARRAGQLDEAEKEMTAAWDISGKKLTIVYLQTARIYEHRGDKEAAARSLEQYLKAEPDSKQAPQIREAITKLKQK